MHFYCILLASDRSIFLWDIENDNYIISFDKHISGVCDISWSNDSNYIVSASDDKTIRIYDITSVFLY